MAYSRKGSSGKSVSSSPPTVAFRSQEMNKHKAEYASMRENERKSPVRNKSVATSRNMNVSQSHRGGTLSRSENSGAVVRDGKSNSLENINMLVGDRNLQGHRGRSSPKSLEKKSAVTRSDAKPEAYRLTENSTSLKNKASKRPPLMKNSSAGNILSRTDQRAKQLNNKLKCYCDPISPSDSVDVGDELDSNLATGRAYDQALLELNLLPKGPSPEKHIIAERVVTPKKSETALTFKGFQTFDGSRFSPIEEASLVLNESTADSCANVVEKEAETMYEHIDLFERFPIKDALQSEVTKEHEILGEYVKMDSIFPLQFSPRQYNYPVNVYQDPFQTKIWQANSEESVSDDKWFTCNSEESTSDGKWSIYSSSESSLALQNDLSSYLGQKHYSFQHQDCDSISSSEKQYFLQHQDCESISSYEKHHFLQHQDCDSISSSILTLDLEELKEKSSSGMNSDIFESEANKIAHQLATSATCGFEEFTSDVSLMHCNASNLVGNLSLQHLDYEEETSLNFSLEKSLRQMDAEFGHFNSKASDELEDNSNQEPLFWPLNPDSYWHDNYDIKSLQSKMDTECQLKADSASVSTRNTTHSLSSDNSEQEGGMQSFSGRKASAPGVGSMPSCRITDFVLPSSEGITSKPPSQLLNGLSRREFGDQNKSSSQSKLKSTGQSMVEKEFASMGKTNDSNRESSALPRVNDISREAKAHSQLVGGSKKVFKLNSSALSSNIKVSNIGKAKHAISPVSSKSSLDDTARLPDENECNCFKITDIKCKQGEKTSRSAALIGGCHKESEEVQDDYLTLCTETHKRTSIYDDCSTEADSVEMFDSSRENKNMQWFTHDLTSVSCDHAVELKAKGNLSLGLGGSECSLFHIGSSSVGSSECMNPGNDRWKLTTGEPFYNNPDLPMGCFESGEDSIEMLVGMKEFDGQEGIGALMSEMIPFPSESSQRETFYSDFDCAILQGTVQNVSTTSNAEGHGENIDFSFIGNSAVLDKDTRLDLSLSSETNTAISSDSSSVLPEGAKRFNFGYSTTLQQLEGNQAVRLKGCCIQDCGQPNGNNGVDSGWNDDLLACIDFDRRSDSNLSALNPEQITVNSMNDESFSRRFCLQKCVENIKGNYAEQGLIYSEPVSPREKVKQRGMFPLLPPRQIGRNNQSLASLKESPFARTSGNIDYQNCGIGCCKMNGDNGRDKVSLSEWDVKDNKRNVVCESGLTTGSSGHHMSGEEHLYCAGISVKDSTACSETSFMNAVHNWTQTGEEEISDTFQGFLFNNPMIKSCFSGILDVNCVKFLEENFQRMLQYLRTNVDNLIEASMYKDSQFHLSVGFEGHQGLQKNTEDNAVLGLQSIEYEDCNFRAGERFENMAKPFCSSSKKKSKEAMFSGLVDKAQRKSKCLEGNPGHMLKEKTKGPKTEEIRVVNDIHCNDSTVTAERPMSTTFLPEAKDILSDLLYFILQSGKKSIAHGWKSHNVNRLADSEIVVVDRKVQALEAELIDIKKQNKKLESVLKSMHIITKRLHQSSQDKKWHRSSRRPLTCKFVLHPRKKKVHRCENLRQLVTSYQNSGQMPLAGS